MPALHIWTPDIFINNLQVPYFYSVVLPCHIFTLLYSAQNHITVTAYLRNEQLLLLVFNVVVTPVMTRLRWRMRLKLIYIINI